MTVRELGSPALSGNCPQPKDNVRYLRVPATPPHRTLAEMFLPLNHTLQPEVLNTELLALLLYFVVSDWEGLL